MDERHCEGRGSAEKKVVFFHGISGVSSVISI